MATNASENPVIAEYTAVIKQDASWWIGWIEEVPGVNCQERSREKLLDSLKTALRETLQKNRRSSSRPLRRQFMRAL